MLTNPLAAGAPRCAECPGNARPAPGCAARSRSRTGGGHLPEGGCKYRTRRFWIPDPPLAGAGTAAEPTRPGPGRADGSEEAARSRACLPPAIPARPSFFSPTHRRKGILVLALSAQSCFFSEPLLLVLVSLCHSFRMFFTQPNIQRIVNGTHRPSHTQFPRHSSPPRPCSWCAPPPQTQPVRRTN